MADINRAGVVFPALLAQAVKDLVSLELSDYVQPTSRELRDAMYVRMYQSAVAMGIIAQGEAMDMKDFLRAVSKINVESDGYNGPVSEDGHKWAGVRIARTLFVVFQSVYHPTAAFGPKQKDLLAFLTTEKPAGSDHPLVAEYVALLTAGLGVNKDGPKVGKILMKDDDEADYLNMLIPAELAGHDAEGFETWLQAPWGGEGTKKKKKRPTGSTGSGGFGGGGGTGGGGGGKGGGKMGKAGKEGGAVPVPEAGYGSPPSVPPPPSAETPAQGAAPSGGDAAAPKAKAEKRASKA